MTPSTSRVGIGRRFLASLTASALPGQLRSDEMPTYNAPKDAERLLRQAWQDDWGSIPIPVDPLRIARRLGIEVYEALLDDDVSAVLVKKLGQDPTIVLNANDSHNRRRFSCAHELGHFIRKSEDQYEYLDQRAHLASTGIDSEEMFANSFAAALLMPEEQVRAFQREGLQDFEMAVKFDVSLEAMRYRINNLVGG